MSRAHIHSSVDAMRALGGVFLGLDHERVYTLYHNQRMGVLKKELTNIGELSTCPVDIRRVVKRALELNATGVILAHNHVGGEPDPSASDIRRTDDLRKALELFDITLTDHIIAGDGCFYSFADGRQTDNPEGL